MYSFHNMIAAVMYNDMQAQNRQKLKYNTDSFSKISTQHDINASPTKYHKLFPVRQLKIQFCENRYLKELIRKDSMRSLIVR